MVDSTGNGRRSNLRHVEGFIRDVVSQLPVTSGQVRIGLGTINSKSQIMFYLNTYRTAEDIRDALSAITYENGELNIAAGVRTMRGKLFSYRQGDRRDVQNIGMNIKTFLSQYWTSVFHILNT